MVDNRSFRIKQFVNTGELPFNIKEYQHPGNLSDYCPFCREVHNDNLHVVPEVAVFHTCDDCEHEIQILKLDKKGGKGTVVSTTESRINLYKREGVFGLDITKWNILHFGHCYFCKRDLLNDDEPLYDMSLPIPVDEGCNGGKVDVCRDCASKLNHKGHNHEHADKCISCGKVYPISSREYTYRDTIVKQYGKYLCPTCVEEIHGTLTQDRFISRECNSCNQSKILDIHQIIRGSLIPEPRQFTCDKCLNGPDPADIIRLDDDPCTIYAIINIDLKKGGCSYAIFRNKTPNIFNASTLIVESEPIYRDPFHASLAAQYKYDELVANRQRQLWL